MQTSGFQGYGRGIRKVGPKFSEDLGVDRASELGVTVRSCGRGVRLLQPPRPRMSPGGCTTTSSYINSPASLYEKFKFLSPIRGTTTSPETAEVLPPSPESTSMLSSSPTTPPQAQCLPNECNFCNRPAGQLVCQTCGHSFHGRVRMRCPHHPVIIHLMDCEFCPQCLSNQLREFKMA